jgi:hypothetical protein
MCRERGEREEQKEKGKKSNGQRTANLFTIVPDSPSCVHSTLALFSLFLFVAVSRSSSFATFLSASISHHHVQAARTIYTDRGNSLLLTQPTKKMTKSKKRKVNPLDGVVAFVETFNQDGT